VPTPVPICKSLALVQIFNYNCFKQRGVTCLDRVNILVERPGSVGQDIDFSETFASTGGEGLFLLII
jgi:hypothetical protein